MRKIENLPLYLPHFGLLYIGVLLTYSQVNKRDLLPINNPLVLDNFREDNSGSLY